MMFGNVMLSAIAHSTCGYDDRIYLRNTSAAINLDDHGDAGPNTTWHFATASGMLAKS